MRGGDCFKCRIKAPPCDKLKIHATDRENINLIIYLC